jgi:tyrosine-protein phosphatase YwqE
VLVELSYFNKSFNTSKYFFELISAGYKVILAHPERYPYFHSDDLEEYQNIIDYWSFASAQSYFTHRSVWKRG